MARKIQLNRALRLGGEHHDIGQVVEVADDVAAELLGNGRASLWQMPEPLPVEDAPVLPPNDAPLNKKLRTRGR
jgi:hypothetical protein